MTAGLVVRPGDHPGGLRCGDCSGPLRDGARYCERLEGVTALGIPVVLLTCAACAARPRWWRRLRGAVTDAWLRYRQALS